VPGHGQSGGDSRIFRHAHDDPRLIEFTRQSRAIWDEWSERLGIELVSRDGVVALGPAVEGRLRLLEQAGGMRARAIDPSELRELLPLLAEYSGPAMFDEAGGAIRAREAIGALARELGDALVADEVISLRGVEGGMAEVRTGGATTTHERVVVCAGRGTAALARGVGLSVPVSLGAHVRGTFEVRANPPPSRLACLQDSSGQFGQAGIYAAPIAGNRRYAVGLSQSVGAQEDGSLLDPGALASLAERAGAYVARGLPGLILEPVELRHCWVTELPWGSDGVAVWESEGIFLVAGHNLFKQAPGLGRAVARAALGAELPAELRPEAKLGRAGD
ncbi:MAG: NAD(P)/FAD-dependent oxidoreductase, partial [Thermoleophilaceae bacterium]